MEQGVVLLRAGGCVVVRVAPGAGWEHLSAVLRGLKEGQGEDVILDTGPLVLGARDLVEVERILKERGYRLVRVVHGTLPEPAEVPSAAAGASVAGTAPVVATAEVHVAATVEVGAQVAAAGAGGADRPGRSRRSRDPGGRVRDQGERTLVRRGPLRSGQVIRYRGNVVILGDVNPGAQVVATGDVIVLGALRGVAHAGADGHRGAVVAALRLCPTQLRIADLVRRAPEGEAQQGGRAELARVLDSEIVVEGL